MSSLSRFIEWFQSYERRDEVYPQKWAERFVHWENKKYQVAIYQKLS